MNSIFEKASTSKIKIEKDTTLTEPFIPYNETLVKIPQNLPIGTSYDIGIRDKQNEISLGEKIDIINSTLNNIIEILSFLVLRQLPDIAIMIKDKLLDIKSIKDKIDEKGLASQGQIITIAEQLTELINTKEPIKNLLETKKSPLKISPPIRLT